MYVGFRLALTGLLWVPAAWLVPYAFSDWLPWAVLAVGSAASLLVLHWLGDVVPAGTNRPTAVPTAV